MALPNPQGAVCQNVLASHLSIVDSAAQSDPSFLLTLATELGKMKEPD